MPELPEGSDTKRCAACRIVKPTSEYYKDRTHSRGIKTRCKQCLRACKEAFKNQQRAKSASEQARGLLLRTAHIPLVLFTACLFAAHSLCHIALHAKQQMHAVWIAAAYQAGPAASPCLRPEMKQWRH